MTNKVRREILVDLFALAENLVLRRGVIKYITEKYNVHRSTIHMSSSIAKRQTKPGIKVNVAHRKQKYGRKSVIANKDIIRQVPLKQRTTLRSLAATLQVSVSTIYRMLKKGIHRSHTLPN